MGILKDLVQKIIGKQPKEVKLEVQEDNFIVERVFTESTFQYEHNDEIKKLEESIIKGKIETCQACNGIMKFGGSVCSDKCFYIWEENNKNNSQKP